MTLDRIQRLPPPAIERFVFSIFGESFVDADPPWYKIDGLFAFVNGTKGQQNRCCLLYVQLKLIF